MYPHERELAELIRRSDRNAIGEYGLIVTPKWVLSDALNQSLRMSDIERRRRVRREWINFALLAAIIMVGAFMPLVVIASSQFFK